MINPHEWKRNSPNSIETIVTISIKARCPTIGEAKRLRFMVYDFCKEMDIPRDDVSVKMKVVR